MASSSTATGGVLTTVYGRILLASLPAASTVVTTNSWSPTVVVSTSSPAGPSTTFAEHGPSRPDSESLHEYSARTTAPFSYVAPTSGTVMRICGGVRSMLMPPAAALEVLPTRSAQEPKATREVPSAERVSVTVASTVPDPASVHSHSTVTAVLFQSFALGGVHSRNSIDGARRSTLLPGMPGGGPAQLLTASHALGPWSSATASAVSVPRGTAVRRVTGATWPVVEAYTTPPDTRQSTLALSHEVISAPVSTTDPPC